eukprot:Sspe_Gene.86197::Locus_56909_Transcript_1_3_Confidence_0.500_Length_1059::g.86197::m.86197
MHPFGRRWVQRRGKATVQEALSMFGFKEVPGQDELARRYRRLARQHHPDLSGGCAKRFQALHEMHQVLKGLLDGSVCDEATAQTMTDEVQQTLRRVLDARDSQEYVHLRQKVMASQALMRDTKLLFLLLDGAPLERSLGSGHAALCVEIITAWETANDGVPASADVFNNVLYPYAFFKKKKVEDGVLVTEGITALVEAMQRRNIDVENEWWSKRLIDKALKNSGKFSAPDLLEADAPSNWSAARAEMEKGSPL